MEESEQPVGATQRLRLIVRLCARDQPPRRSSAWAAFGFAFLGSLLAAIVVARLGVVFRRD
jgi:hypothetical protein